MSFRVQWFAVELPHPGIFAVEDGAATIVDSKSSATVFDQHELMYKHVPIDNHYGDKVLQSQFHKQDLSNFVWMPGRGQAGSQTLRTLKRKPSPPQNEHCHINSPGHVVRRRIVSLGVLVFFLPCWLTRVPGNWRELLLESRVSNQMKKRAKLLGQ